MPGGTQSSARVRVIVNVIVNVIPNEQKNAWYVVCVSQKSHLGFFLIQVIPKTNSLNLKIGLTHQTDLCFRLLVLRKQNLEIMEIKTLEFMGNGAHCVSRIIILARAWTKHAVLSKVRNSFWFRQ